MSESLPPDFAMVRAVEILADLYKRQTRTTPSLPPAADKPFVLFNESLALDVNATTRIEVQKALGIAFSYPTRGWHTYCVRGAERRREFLSLFYSDQQLISAELYFPQTDRSPKLEPVDLRFRLIPGEISLGAQYAELPESFAPVEGLLANAGTYAEMFSARYPGGTVYAMGNKGRIERLALYVLRAEPPSQS